MALVTTDGIPTHMSCLPFAVAGLVWALSHPLYMPERIPDALSMGSLSSRETMLRLATRNLVVRYTKRQQQRQAASVL